MPVCAQAEDAAAEPAAPAAASGTFSEEQEQLLWESVTRALLRLGKSGATESHTRSLSELLDAHKMVKVQVNAPASTASAAAAALAAGAGARLVMTKGSTLLFAQAGAAPEGLLQLATESKARTAVYREKLAAAREKKRDELRATEAKRESNTSRSTARTKIHRMIDNVSGGGGGGGGGGDLSRSALLGEWQQLAAGIAAEEAGDESQLGAPKSKEPQQPWKRREAAAGAEAGRGGGGRRPRTGRGGAPPPRR
ncbi:hypothetical protein Rsub_05594 [Raphidocelis subcapitata]|uniref:CRM domain-containing protein n=1 Tax=Raphidocelis subcapitata TaxID=307507 RepID=A0A2V0P0E5_9CHLO|nr:hypothetical protein Rsub_05594 [Raphidocelis subcapitata]|eukprot:GBF92392.1 hypothetical protein Rsub_05594 [Raphidocelis subcapitata]